MHQDKYNPQLPLLSWPSLADRYPLCLHIDTKILERVYEELVSLINQSFPLELESVGTLYQQIISAPLAIGVDGVAHIDLSSDKRAGGEFYTPSWVADYAFQQWLNADSAALLPMLKTNNADLLPSILDPSCGTGNFLLAAIRLADRLELSAEQEREFAGRSLYGRDIDGCAVELCKLLILISLSKSFQDLSQSDTACAINLLLSRLDQNIRCADSLLLSSAPVADFNEKRLAASANFSKPVPNDGHKFDLVITNPPYISFGSRDQQQISSQWQQMLKRRFPASSEYKLRYTSIFQEIGIELSCKSVPPGQAQSACAGQCIFLVPDAFLTGSYYQKLRNLILNKVDIAGLSELPSSTISDATVGRWCLAHYKQKQLSEPGNNRTETDVNLYRVSNGSNGLVDSHFQMPDAALVSKDRQRFQLLFCKEDLDILLLCKELGFLGEVLKGHTGIRSRNGQSSIIAQQKASPFHSRGLISGAELSSFNVDWQGNWLELVPQNLFAGGFDPEVISGPKILLRQTGDRLIAAVDRSGLYHLNNVHSFVPRLPESRAKRIHFYACLLNSKFYLYFYRLKTREHKRALAQIDIETVEHMPLPLSNMPIEAELEELGRCLAKEDFADKERTKTKVDQLIFQLFGLDRAMQQHISSAAAAQI